jgi:hypothetical protein
MKIVYIILILIISGCSPRYSPHRSCNIEFMNTYLDKCQEHCLYEDDGYDCKDTCVEYAEEKYCK